MREVEIYIPAHLKTLEFAINSFAVFFGGVTAYHAGGLWVDENNLPVEEKVVIVRGITDMKFKSIIKVIETIVEKMKEEGEDTVLYTTKTLDAHFV